MNITDILSIIAILAGPIVAVQLTRYLDVKKEVRERKLWVFKTLMATRAYALSPVHVEALNRIDLEFKVNISGEREVIETWRQYLDLLGNRQMPFEQWDLRRVDLLVDMLYHMGHALGYKFDKIQIKNGTYSPVAHGRIEAENDAIRQGVLDILQGKRELPIKISGTGLEKLS